MLAPVSPSASSSYSHFSRNNGAVVDVEANVYVDAGRHISIFDDWDLKWQLAVESLFRKALSFYMVTKRYKKMKMAAAHSTPLPL